MKYIHRRDGEIMLGPYLDYIAEMAERLPPGARHFALLPYHYEIVDRRCPHDAWLEFANVVEINARQDRGSRSISILTRFLGSYHDGYFELVYSNVHRYRMSLKTASRKAAQVGHADWIVDEILLDRSGRVSHEIEFENGSWKIMCEDILYSWHSIS
jgi:hypothetical protein